MPSTAEWKELESKYYMFLVRRQPMVLEKGDGARVWDVDGKEYLDFTSGWAVNNAGHSNPVIAEAIAEQAKTLVQTSNQFYTIPQLKLAEILVENSCLDKIFICNSGAEWRLPYYNCPKFVSWPDDDECFGDRPASLSRTF